MKIVADRNIPFLEGRVRGADLVMLPSSAIDRDVVREADALIVRTRTICDASLLEGSRVKAVATATIGLDHIDLDWCGKNGIAVSNAPGCNAPGVALYVWASLLRNGFRPGVSVLGVVGCGNVGGIIARWGRKLGSKVLVCDPPRVEAGNADHDYRSLEEVLAESDAVTLHTPLTHTGLYPTWHMIGENELRMIKASAIFVNAARGEIADNKALVGAIAEGRIGKAIIDTWEGEPNINEELLRLAVVATPHIAGYSVEGKQRASRMALEAITQSLGIETDTTGLAPAYHDPADLTPEKIMAAYDPAPMTAALRSNPSAFESLRNSYALHSEIGS